MRNYVFTVTAPAKGLIYVSAPTYEQAYEIALNKMDDTELNDIDYLSAEITDCYEEE
nr:MAG TPA: hypothetical protein [Caudoviricetes sp.]